MDHNHESSECPNCGFLLKRNPHTDSHKPEHPLLKFAGILQNDPLIEEWIQCMAENRRISDLEDGVLSIEPDFLVVNRVDES
jgi:hypothetical protein